MPLQIPTESIDQRTIDFITYWKNLPPMLLTFLNGERIQSTDDGARQREVRDAQKRKNRSLLAKAWNNLKEIVKDPEHPLIPLPINPFPAVGFTALNVPDFLKPDYLPSADPNPTTGRASYERTEGAAAGAGAAEGDDLTETPVAGSTLSAPSSAPVISFSISAGVNNLMKDVHAEMVKFVRETTDDKAKAFQYKNSREVVVLCCYGILEKILVSPDQQLQEEEVKALLTQFIQFIRSVLTREDLFFDVRKVKTPGQSPYFAGPKAARTVHALRTLSLAAEKICILLINASPVAKAEGFFARTPERIDAVIGEIQQFLTLGLYLRPRLEKKPFEDANLAISQLQNDFPFTLVSDGADDTDNRRHFDVFLADTRERITALKSTIGVTKKSDEHYRRYCSFRKLLELGALRTEQRHNASANAKLQLLKLAGEKYGELSDADTSGGIHQPLVKHATGAIGAHLPPELKRKTRDMIQSAIELRRSADSDYSQEVTAMIRRDTHAGDLRNPLFQSLRPRVIDSKTHKSTIKDAPEYKVFLNDLTKYVMLLHQLQRQLRNFYIIRGNPKIRTAIICNPNVTNIIISELRELHTTVLSTLLKLDEALNTFLQKRVDVVYGNADRGSVNTETYVRLNKFLIQTNKVPLHEAMVHIENFIKALSAENLRQCREQLFLTEAALEVELSHGESLEQIYMAITGEDLTGKAVGARQLPTGLLIGGAPFAMLGNKPSPSPSGTPGAAPKGTGPTIEILDTAHSRHLALTDTPTTYPPIYPELGDGEPGKRPWLSVDLDGERWFRCAKNPDDPSTRIMVRHVEQNFYSHDGLVYEFKRASQADQRHCLTYVCPIPTRGLRPVTDAARSEADRAPSGPIITEPPETDTNRGHAGDGSGSGYYPPGHPHPGEAGGGWGGNVYSGTYGNGWGGDSQEPSSGAAGYGGPPR